MTGGGAELRAVSFAYPGQPPLFSRVDLRLPASSAIAVLGPNGRGKSTLLRLLAGLERPVAGRVIVAGTDTAVAGPRDLARLVGMVAQSSDRHFLRTSVAEEVALGPRLLGLPDSGGLARRALERLAIADLSAQHPLDLDAGQRRLVALAVAIVHRPRLLLLDEAQRGLDRIHRTRLEEVIAAEAAAGTTVVAVTHDTDFARRIATMALILPGEGQPFTCPAAGIG